MPETSSPFAPPSPSAPAPASGTRYRRSRQDRVIAGVAGGLARELGVDPLLVRLGFVALTALGGIGLIAYAVCWLVMPEDDAPVAAGTPVAVPGAAPTATTRPSGIGAAIVGVLLVVVGVNALLGPWLPSFTWSVALPLFVIGLGAAAVVHGARRR